ncbi:MAG: outer membrane beta-barrel protein [Syntrophaceae bacterium]
MKKILIVLVLVSCFVIAPVCSAQEGWRASAPKGYFGIFGGYSFPQDLETENLPDAGLDGSWVAGAKLGGFFARPLMLEIEYYHIGEMDLDRKIFADSVSTDSVFLNVILRYPETSFHPFIGAGAGWAWSHLKNVNSVSGAISADDNNWAVQALAGVDIELSDKASLVFQYRYFYTEPTFITDNDSKVRSHLLTVGINFFF